jgi:NAD(P) transhydrogenase
MEYDYDLVVIGGGPAGERGAELAAEFGKRVALVECKADPGGACVHTGTLPSKTLREAALELTGFVQRKLHGLDVRLDKGTAVPRLMSRKDAVRTSEVTRIRRNLTDHKVEILGGSAAFVGDHCLEVTSSTGTRRLTTAVALLATGSNPFRPREVPFDDPDVDDSDTILDMDVLPERLTVIGGGVIGCEYASMFAALGSRVTVIEGRAQVLPFLDREVADGLVRAMEAHGVTFHLGRRYTRVGRVGKEIVTTCDDGSEVPADRLLFAAGRSGNTQGLGLERVGLTPDKRGNLAADMNYQTAVPWIYAAGDVVGNPGLASTGMEQARVAMKHAFSTPDLDSIGHLLPYGIYSIPEVSSVGETEGTCQEKKVPYAVGRSYYHDNARGKIIGDTEGFIKLVVERPSGRILGVHLLGERATELVHLGQLAMWYKGTVAELSEMVFNYPTLAEGFKYACYDAMASLAREP